MSFELVGPFVLAALAGLSEPPEAPAAPAQVGAVRVAMFDGRGVSKIGFEPARQLLEHNPTVALEVVSATQVRAGVLRDQDVVIFMGGSGSRQGGALEPEGRQVVRDFVARGGGYIGVCAGAYLAMQGEEEFNKLRIVSAKNLSGDFWKRGVAPATVKVEGSSTTFKLHFANGPVFEPVRVDGLPPFVTLATYESDLHASRHGTEPGQMPGTAAILASQFEQGRLLLFSPNPVLGLEGVAHPEIFLAAIRWVAAAGEVKPDLRYSDVFPSPSPAR